MMAAAADPPPRTDWGTITAHRLRLLGNGYSPIPIQGKRPAPGVMNWRERLADPTEADIRSWPAEYPTSPSTGLLCGDQVVSCVAVPADMAGQDRKKKRTLSPKLHHGVQVLADVIARHGTRPPPTIDLPQSVMVAPIEAWRQRFYSGEGSDIAADTKLKRFQRLRDQLKAAGAIGICDDWVWIIREPQSVGGETGQSRTKPDSVRPCPAVSGAGRHRTNAYRHVRVSGPAPRRCSMR